MHVRTPLVLIAAALALAGCGADNDLQEALDSPAPAEQEEEQEPDDQPLDGDEGAADEGETTTLRAVSHDEVDGDVAELLPDDVAFPEGTSVIFSDVNEGDYSVSGQYELAADVDDVAAFYRAHFADLGWELTDEQEIVTDGERGWRLRFESDEQYELIGYDTARYEVSVALQEDAGTQFAQISWTDRRGRGEHLDGQ